MERPSWRPVFSNPPADRHRCARMQTATRPESVTDIAFFAEHQHPAAGTHVARCPGLAGFQLSAHCLFRSHRSFRDPCDSNIGPADIGSVSDRNPIDLAAVQLEFEIGNASHGSPLALVHASLGQYRAITASNYSPVHRVCDYSPERQAGTVQ